WALWTPTKRFALAAGAAVLACTLIALALREGLAYVPGLLVASPLAAIGLLAVVRVRGLAVLGALALVPMPLIWVTQYADTQRFQWGNRYALTSGVLLAVAALVALRGQRAALVAALCFAALVTIVGIAFVSNRTHSIANGMEGLVRRSGVLVST